MTDSQHQISTLEEGVGLCKEQLTNLLQDTYELRQGITLSSRVINRYDPEFVITKEGIIIAVVEVTRQAAVNDYFRQRLAKVARNFSCAFGVIYCYDTENLSVLDVMVWFRHSNI